MDLKQERKIKSNDPRLLQKMEDLEILEKEYDSQKILQLRKAVRKQIEFDKKYP